MESLLQFSLLDMTPYDRQSWFNLIEAYNQSLFFSPLISLLFGISLLWLIFKVDNPTEKYALLLLSICWLWCGWVFFRQYYASLNWAAALFSWLYIAQALLLALVALFDNKQGWRANNEIKACLGVIVLFTGLLIYPLAGLLEGRNFTQLEWFAITPTATTIGSIAVSMLLQHRIRFVLLIIPVLWCLIAAAFAWTLGLVEFYFTVACVLILILYLFMGNRPQSNRI